MTMTAVVSCKYLADDGQCLCIGTPHARCPYEYRLSDCNYRKSPGPLSMLDFHHNQVEFDEGGEKRLQECIEFVNTKRPDLAENLKFQFTRHYDYYFKNHPEIKMRVYSDFARLSFYFEMKYFDFKAGEFKRDYNGGIIFHGNDDGGGNGGAPTYSVNISPVDGWATHT